MKKIVRLEVKFRTKGMYLPECQRLPSALGDPCITAERRKLPSIAALSATLLSLLLGCSSPTPTGSYKNFRNLKMRKWVPIPMNSSLLQQLPTHEWPYFFLHSDYFGTFQISILSLGWKITPMWETRKNLRSPAWPSSGHWKVNQWMQGQA